MANLVTPTPYFLSRAKRLIKKYRSLEDSLLQLEQNLLENPTMGANYGSNIYKVRVADESKGKGKSGGFRIIDKSEEATIKKEQIKKLIKSMGL